MTEIDIKESLNVIKEEKSLEKYLEIMEQFPLINVSKDKNFQRLFNGFYKIMKRPQEFLDAYYLFMENHKNSPPSFKETLRYLYKFGNLEASFSSKLLATINPMLPVWDKYVLKYFELKGPSQKISTEARINRANNVYGEINQRYYDFLSTDESKIWIKLFDEHYPEEKDRLTPIKKIDLIIWQTRK